MTPDLPPLPEPRTLSRGDEDGPIQLGYTADQMRTYAAEAVRVARIQALEDAARHITETSADTYGVLLREHGEASGWLRELKDRT